MISPALDRLLNKSLSRFIFLFAFFLVTIGLSQPLQAQLSVPLTIQEALYPGAPTNGITRSQDVVTVGVPLADSQGITSTSQLGLAGATAGQFRVLARWPSGNIKWVLVDTQADVPAGLQNNSISLVNGNGNFGGPNLATDNGGSISVNTGVAQFVIRKANFNLFDQVVVGGKTVVQSGTSAGLVLMGPTAPNTSCGVCNVPYSSANDAHSTAFIEENGPVRTAIRVDGSHVDGNGHAYMHFTVRMYFFRGKSFAKVTVTLRNADQSTSLAGDFNSAYKGFASYEARVGANLGNSRNFSFSTDSSNTVTGSFSSSENAYLYQAYSDKGETNDWNAFNCTSPGNAERCVYSFIKRTPTQSGFTYAQDGYQIVHGNSVLMSADHTKYPQGFADLADGTGAGIEVGVKEFSAYWPKSLQFMSGGSEVRVGIWPDQSLFTKGGGQPYYQAWPAYSVHDVYFNFHSSALPSAADDFLSFQHNLIARTSLAQYNKAAVFPYPLIDPAAQDNYLNSISVVSGLPDIPFKVWRRYDWPAAGGGNQHEMRWSWLRNFLERGNSSRYVTASNFYHYMLERAFPRADGFTWRTQAISVLDVQGYPKIASANGALAHRDWVDPQHAHWYGMPDYYFMTGDEAIKDEMEGAVKDYLLNAQAGVNNGHMYATRDVGERLMAIARMYIAYNAMSDPDASNLLPIADNILNLQVFPELSVSGYGTAAQGISRTRGLHYGCCPTDQEPPNFAGRDVLPFQQAILEEGLYELAQARGKAWPQYTLALDLSYGLSMFGRTEGYGTIINQQPNYQNTGFRYLFFIDEANAGMKYFDYQLANTETEWFHFFIPAVYAGDTSSWKQALVWYLQHWGSTGNTYSEYNSHMMDAVLNQVLNPPSAQLTSVQASVTNNNNGSYTLTWTVPDNTTGYRIKYAVGKSIVDWIGFNARTNQFTGNPATTTPWFAATEVVNTPAPNKPNTQQVFTVSGLDPSKTYNFAVKAIVGGSQGDHTPPTVAVTAPANNANVSGTVPLSANASDNVAVAWVQFSVDGKQIGSPIFTPPYSASWDSTTVANGVHTITATASDTSSNISSASVQVTVSNSGDHTPPTVAITSPAKNATVQNTVTVSANATDNVAVAWVLLEVDGQPIGPKLTTPPYSVSWNTTTASNGLHTITAIASDTSNNQSTTSEQVTVNNSGDHTPPTVTITNPAANAIVSGTVNLSATATDNVSVSWVFFEVDNIAVSPKITTPPYTFAWNSANVANGNHTITAVASDPSNNTGVASIPISTNNSHAGPSVTFVSPQANANVSGTVNVTASVSNMNVIGGFVFTANGKVIGTIKGPNPTPPYSVAWDTTKFANGNVTLGVTVAGSSTNQSAYASEPVTVNNSGSGPSVSITSPAPGNVSGTVIFAANATSNVGIKNVAFFVDQTLLGTASAPPYQVSFNTTTVGNGPHTLTATATDKLNNQGSASENVSVANAQQTVTLSPVDFNFGHQKVGTKSAPQTATLRNGLATTLNITSITASGDFTQSNNCGSSLGAGLSCNIVIVFAPTAAGTRVGTLTVSDNAPNSPQTASLSGYGDTGQQGNCPANAWCQVYSKPLLPNNGYNRIFYAHETGKFYLYAGNFNQPATLANGPEATTMWSYSIQSSPVQSNPWVQVSDCNDNANTELRQQMFVLNQNISATDTSAVFAVGQNGTSKIVQQNTIPQSGTWWIGDEAMTYNGCDELTPNFVPGSCGLGTTTFRLNNLVRGVRQAAGWLAPYAHTGGSSGPTGHGDAGNLACPAPTLNSSNTSDHPPSRHSAANPTYDSTRGAIWMPWGWQENWSLQDTWYLCVYQTSFCTAQKIAAGWQRLPMYTHGGYEPGGYTENGTIYDPDTDSLFSVGGYANGNATADQFVFCLSSPTTAYGCNGKTFQWIKVTPHGGNPGRRDAPRMVWDSVNHKILVMGGMGLSNVYTNTVAIYDSKSGDWCISDPTQYGANAPSCALPAISGNVPPVGLQNKWASWAYDTLRQRATYYDGTHLYQYNDVTNQWTQTSVTGGPPPALLNQKAHTSFAYDDITDSFVWVSGGVNGQLWQLPGSAIAP